MSEERGIGSDNATGEGQAPGEQRAALPVMRIQAQYVKDLSFENPKGPAALAQAQGRPQIELEVDVRAGQPSPNGQQEMVLELTVTVKAGDSTLFLIQLAYAALVLVQHVKEEVREQFLLVECPRLLFPFARRIIADLAREGGFPPLLIEPIDFLALYRNRLARRQRQQAAADGAEPPGAQA